jgi:hypothetical protein
MNDDNLKKRRKVMRRVWSVFAAALLVASLAGNAFSQDPVQCKVASYQPEVLSFHGDSTTVLNRLEELKSALPISQLRVYMFLLETANSAELSLFERVGEDNFTVSKWNGKSAGDLREQITNRMLGNRGVLCIGEQSKALVAQRVSTTKVGSVATPVSARAAFGHSIQKYGNQYMRLTVFLFC